MECGFSIVDITPPLGLELSGFGYFLERYATEIESPLCARTLVFQQGEQKALIMSCDLIGLDKALTEKARDEISKRHNIPKSAIAIAATHTHAGPATATLYGLGEKSPEYIEKLYDYLLLGAKLAFEDISLVSGTKSVRTTVDPINYNRTYQCNIVDNIIKGILVERPDKKPVVLINYGCHPVTLGPKNMYSPDYCGKVTAYLEKSGFDAMFLSGLCGDMNPVQNIIAWGSGTVETITEYGDRIGKAFLTALNRARAYDAENLEVNQFSYNIALQQYTEKEICACESETPNTTPFNIKLNKVITKWGEVIREKLKNSQSPYEEQIDVLTFKIGKTLMVLFPHETFQFPGIFLKYYFPEYILMSAGNTNYTNRYFALAENINARQYEGRNSMYFYQCLPVVPGELEKLTLKLLNDLKKFY